MLRCDFLAFVSKVYATLNPGEALTPDWPNEAMAYALAECQAGTTPRLIVTMPPRSLKSITFSVAWPAWLLGQEPTTKIMCVSYSDELATFLSRDCRRVLRAAWYRELFPGSDADPRSTSTTPSACPTGSTTTHWVRAIRGVPSITELTRNSPLLVSQARSSTLSSRR